MDSIIRGYLLDNSGVEYFEWDGTLVHRDSAESVRVVNERLNHMHTKPNMTCSKAVCVCVCVCVFIKLHITTQSGPVILVILCVCVCVSIKLHITAQSGPVILVILCHSH